MGIAPTIAPDQLRGVALCCGIYDFAGPAESGSFERFITTVGWSYSGTRAFREDQRFIASVSVARHVTGDFPPTFLTVGNADPLAPQSAALAEALCAAGVDVETLFHPAGHQPPLGHEYQFDLGLDDGRAALERLTGFLERCASDRALDLEAEGLRC
jgi:acetyl esterase/lipase